MNRLLRKHLATLLLLAGQGGLASMLPAQAGTVPAQKDAVVPSAEDKRKALEADAERLVRLAQQLRADVEHTRQDELSVKVVRDADEIDRLARSTRTRVH